MLMSSVKKSLKVLANCCQFIWVTLLWSAVGHFPSKMKLGFSRKEPKRSEALFPPVTGNNSWNDWKNRGNKQDKQTEVKRQWTDGRSLDGERTKFFTLPQHWDQGCRVKFGFLWLLLVLLWTVDRLLAVAMLLTLPLWRQKKKNQKNDAGKYQEGWKVA